MKKSTKCICVLKADRSHPRDYLDDFKVALYVCPNPMDDDIHSDHAWLFGHLGHPCRTTLK